MIYIVNEDDLICIGDSDSEAHKLMDLTEWSALKKIAILNFCDHCDQGKDIYNSHDQVHENKKETWDKAQVEQVVQSWVEKEEGEPDIFSFGLIIIHKKSWYSSWFIMIFLASSHLVSVLATRSLAQWSMMDGIDQKLNFYGVATSPILDVDFVNIFSCPSCQ